MLIILFFLDVEYRQKLLPQREYALEVHDEEYIKFIEMLPLKAKDLKAYYKYLPDNPEGRKEFVASAGTSRAVFLAAGAMVEVGQFFCTICQI